MYFHVSSSLAIPIYIGVGVALVGAVVALVLARRCCGPRFKAPLTPPTPRLTQYEQPEDTESCRLTADTCGTLPRDTCRALASPRAVSHTSVHCGACSIYSGVSLCHPAYTIM